MPAYCVVSEDGPAQIRTYLAMLVAEVTIEAASLADAAGEGFAPLASYIFGSNTPRQKIAMRSPFMAARKTPRAGPDTRHETGPETGPETGAAAFEVRFIMPREWTIATLPTPSDPAVHFEEVPGRTMASLRYTGRDTALSRSEAEAALRVFITRQGFVPDGAAEWAGYDNPAVPFWMRRYEVLLPVAPANKK